MKQKFTLDWTWTPEQKEMSEYLFSGKLIKLYYSKNIDISDNYFEDTRDNFEEGFLKAILNNNTPVLSQINQVCLAFPERLMCLESMGQLVSKVIKSAAKEIIILTTTPYLMLEFNTSLVTIIDNYKFTAPAGFDTLVANMHDVYYKTHGYELFGTSKNIVNSIIKDINNKKLMTDFEKKVVNSIGEPLMKNKLNQMIRENLPKKDARQAEIEYLEQRIAELEALRKTKTK